MQALRYLNFKITLLLEATFVSASILFLFCYFGRLTTENYEEMANSLYDSNWHEISVQQQKSIFIMITNMQTPVQYHGFGIATLNLETFSKVRRKDNATNVYFEYIIEYFVCSWRELCSHIICCSKRLHLIEWKQTFKHSEYLTIFEKKCWHIFNYSHKMLIKPHRAKYLL